MDLKDRVDQVREFARQVSYIFSLEMNNKISSPQAYEKIYLLWQQLESSLNDY
jgi:hypothetical protein